MLTPDARTVLLDDLRAPAGYEVDHAVATTFTLDLTAAMLPPFAFADLGATSTRMDPIALLQALRHASGKVDIFCQAGSIGVPRTADLVAFLEPMVHQVIPPTGGLFHPKVWVMRFVSDEAEPMYRLLVLSRNLTHDNSWDIAVRLDSESITDAPQEINTPLADLLRWLPANTLHLEGERVARLRALADEVSHVQWERPEDVQSLSFHAVGIPGQPEVSFHAGRHLVISPFVEADGLRRVTAGGRQPPTLVSRQETLDDLAPEVLDGMEVFTLAADADIPTADVAGDELAEETPAPTLSGLHAKAYLLEPSHRWARASALLGSSNATGPGLTKNVEFLVEVIGRRRTMGIDRLLPPDAESTDGLRPLVEPYVRQEPEDRTEERTRRRLQRTLRRIAGIEHVIEVIREAPPSDSSAPQSYSAMVTASRAYPTAEDVTSSIALLTRTATTTEVDAHPHLIVHELPAADITPCIVVTVTEGGISESTVLLGRLDGAPEGRLDAVIARQVDDREKFMRLLMLLLSLGTPSQLAALLAGRARTGDSAGSIDITTSGVLELVLRGLSTRSPAIDDIDHLITRVLDDEVLPEGFFEFWQEVSAARHILGEDAP